MRLQRRWFVPFAIILVVFFCSAAHAENKFHLKPGAAGKNCLKCHVTFQDKLKNPFVHTPVKEGECIGCHSPHTAAHGKLLAADPSKICRKCHTGIVPEKPVSFHPPVAEGACVKCHDPHSAPNKYNLKKAGSALCFGCHKQMGEKIAAYKVKHPPVQQDCTNCHNPHGSASSEHLLKKSVPALCASCHQVEGNAFKKKHFNYPVGKANCLSCHNPHGSSAKALLYPVAHKPFAQRMCNQCHEGPRSATPLKRKKEGYELCMGCHRTTVDGFFSKNRVHWALLDKKGCLNCHNPHVSPEEKLLRGDMFTVCGKCHSDRIEKIKKAKSQHPPVQEQMCTVCHSPHSSNQLSLLTEPSVITLCGTCHDWEHHSTHPIGKDYPDPRNKNLHVVCISCHRPHGTEFKHMLEAEDINVVCTRCHKTFKR